MSCPVSVALFALIVTANCSPESGSSVGVGTGAQVSIMRARALALPPRGSEAHPLKSWADQTDTVLWNAIVASGNLAAIGFKIPGTARGQWQGQPVIDSVTWAESERLLELSPFVEVVQTDPTLPRVRALISSLEGLSWLRQQGFVDYIEPALLRVMYASSCDQALNNLPVQTTPSGDVYSSRLSLMGIEGAWAMIGGGSPSVRIGLTDTGADQTYRPPGSPYPAILPGSELSPTHFRNGWSAGRDTMRHTVTSRNSEALNYRCDHGTNMAGIMSAPWNGRSVGGIAYKTGLVSVWQDSDVMPDHSDAANAIDDAVVWGASKVVVMAWGTAWWHDDIADKIRAFILPPYDVVFVASAGTSAPGYSDRHVLFPGNMSEVFTVSSIEENLDRPGSAHYGSDVDAVTYYDLATLRMDDPDRIDKVGGTSSSTAVVGALAALVRAKYPTYTQQQVRDKLEATSGVVCGQPGPPQAWHRVINAYAAVGGICLEKQIRGPMYVQIPLNQSSIQIPYSVSLSGGINTAVIWAGGTGGTTYGASTLRTFARGNYTTWISARVDDVGLPNLPSEVTDVLEVQVTIADFTVTVQGPSLMRAGDAGSWTAYPSNGFDPYAYRWYLNGADTGVTDPTYSNVMSIQGTNSLVVVVTDAQGNVRETLHQVDVTSNGECCIS